MAAYINKSGKLVIEYEHANREMAITEHFCAMRAIIHLLQFQEDTNRREAVTGDALVLLENMLPDEAVLQKAWNP
jgi:hypothetical protein